MQHGTAREYVIDLVENAYAITTQPEVGQALRRALEALADDDLDEPGVYGPDYGVYGPSAAETKAVEDYYREKEQREKEQNAPRVTKRERAEAMGISTVLGFETLVKEGGLLTCTCGHSHVCPNLAGPYDQRLTMDQD